MLVRYKLKPGFRSLEDIIFLNYNYYLYIPSRPGHACHNPDHWLQFFKFGMNSDLIQFGRILFLTNENLGKNANTIKKMILSIAGERELEI